MVAHELLQADAAVPADADDPLPRPPTRAGDAVTVPPADVTTVVTGEQLQAAFADVAQDIEIRAHLDMRGLTRTPNQMLESGTDYTAVTRLALLYAQPPMRSMRVRVPLAMVISAACCT